MNRSALPLLVLTSALAACVAPPAETDRAEQPFSTTPGEPNHEAITGDGLSFLRSEIVVALQAANVATDVQFVLDSAAHFDDCNFSGGSQRVADSEAAAVAALGAGNDVEAIRMFGRALHAVQDFYAHSNWVELGGTTLVSSSLTAWPAMTGYATLDPSGFLVIEGTRKSTSLFRKQGAKYPESAVVTARTAKGTSFGLISGTVDYEPGDKCPAQIAMTHDELRKDKSTLTDRVPQYLAAKSLATQQTRHEWCRLLTMTRAAHGEAGDQRLFTWVSDVAAASQCGAATDLSVTATVNGGSIAVAYANSGTTSYGSRVRVNLPLGTVATGDGCTLAGVDVLDCTVGQLASGATGTVMLSVTASVGGDVSATVSAHVTDSNPANNTATATLAPIVP